MDRIKTRLSAFARLIEHTLSIGAKLLIGLAVAGLVGLSGYLLTRTDANITSPTVMITNLRGNSGGSGVVIKRSKNLSTVLTNSHVCEVVVNGGLVTTVGGESHTVTSYQQSRVHDLCLITVNADLKYQAKISSRAANMYEEAVISGHPNLLPNVVAKGHFSGNKVIQVMTGWRDCTDEDEKQNDVAIACLFFGRVPVVRSYETILVTAMIMPGSSGSAVYNSDLEISGLVFAGNGEMSYAYIVPVEFIQQFLESEIKTLEPRKPNYILDLREVLGKQSVDKPQFEQEVKKKCEKVTDQDLLRMCDIIVRDLNWRRSVQ